MSPNVYNPPKFAPQPPSTIRSDGYKTGLDPDALVNAQYHTGATRFRGASATMDFQSTGRQTMMLTGGDHQMGGLGGTGAAGGLGAELEEGVNDTPEEKARKRAAKADLMARWVVGSYFRPGIVIVRPNSGRPRPI